MIKELRAERGAWSGEVETRDHTTTACSVVRVQVSPLHPQGHVASWLVEAMIVA